MEFSPFREYARKVAAQMGYVAMQVHSDGARSHSWWKNLVDYGAWRGPGGTRVNPPPPEALPGIAKLFGLAEWQVAAMIAADWYGVVLPNAPSQLVARLGPALDRLPLADATFVEILVTRLLTNAYPPIPVSAPAMTA